jgi:hypothetical protein
MSDSPYFFPVLRILFVDTDDTSTLTHIEAILVPFLEWFVY